LGTCFLFGMIGVLTYATSAYAEEKKSSSKVEPAPGLPLPQVQSDVSGSPEPRPVPSKNDRPEQDLRNSQALWGAAKPPREATPLETLGRRIRELEGQRQQLDKEYQKTVESLVLNMAGYGPNRPPGVPAPTAPTAPEMPYAPNTTPIPTPPTPGPAVPG